MNQRERILAIAVGVMLVAVVGWFVEGYISSQFTQRRTDISSLEKEIKKFKRQIMLGQGAAHTISEFEQRSLPSNPEIARSHYHDWLASELGKAGLIEQDVKAKQSQVEKDLYVLQTFDVSAKGTLPQTIDLLHAFYSVDWLHRIRTLTIKPIPDSKLLDVHLDVDALSLVQAPSATELVARPSKRLALPDRQAYHAVIGGRNLFGPPNQPPRLTVSGSKDVNTSRPAELNARGTDPDPLDKLSYTLVKSAAPEARLDPASGRFSWTPRSPGTYEFIFQASDDGLPKRSSEPVKVVLNVTDALPPAPAGPPRLAFDQAKFTVLTAVLDIGGTGEVWLHVRPTGQTLKLHAGDQFEIGSIKGTVAEIRETDFVFEYEGKRRKLAKGEILEQAQLQPAIGGAAQAPDASPTVKVQDDL